MAEVMFFLASLGAIAGAIGVVALRNPFYSVLALVSHLVALAALFLLLRAEFVAAAQVVVYAGAVMVLYVFVVAYIGGADEQLGPETGRGLKVLAGLGGFALFVELSIAIIGSSLPLLKTEGTSNPGSGSPERIGELLLTKFLLPFEVASFLLLIAAVGAVVLARRRGGITGEEDADVISAADLLKPAAVGTMAEGAGHTIGGRRVLPEPDEAAKR